ncbi:MAG: TIGR00266 family protein [Planctomycetales bacterium]|nr:TIGR00266 family protein [Planctomycetales bacterium]
MHQWYLNIDGQQYGPMDLAQARQMVAQKPQAMCWRQGFPEWLPASKVAEMTSSNTNAPPSQVKPAMADEIDYKIFGEDMQYVEVELDPGESAVAEAGSMMFKDAIVRMDTVFGDGSQGSQAGGFFDKLVGAGKRLITGESLFTTVFTHGGPSGKARVGFAAPYPGTIIPLQLSNYNGRIICQKDSFLAAAKGVQIGIHFQKKILTGLFGGEGFIMQKLDGDGLVFIHAGGTIREYELGPGETLHVDTGCLVALTQTVNYDVQRAGNIKSMIFGGEGLFLAHLTGPGHVWLQSLPFSRLAGRIYAAIPSRGGSKGEGSILGGLGNLLDGD